MKLSSRGIALAVAALQIAAANRAARALDQAVVALKISDATPNSPPKVA